MKIVTLRDFQASLILAGRVKAIALPSTFTGLAWAQRIKTRKTWTCDDFTSRKEGL